MLWINFLHLYQPANTQDYIIKEAAEKSYWRLIRALKDNPQTHFTFNITGCLLVRLEELGYKDLLKELAQLIKSGQLEVVGTAAYHPILPLISEDEAKRQIKENEKIQKKYFGPSFRSAGFFLPELAYSPKTGRLIKSLGYKWLLLDEFAHQGKINAVDFNKVYLDINSKLKIVFRSRYFSNSYVPQMIIEQLSQPVNKQPNIIITATDGELYGLRHNDITQKFEKLLKRRDLTTLTISEFIKKQPQVTVCRPITSSWATSEKELKQKNPFALWRDKNNPIQKKLWRLANFASRLTEANQKDPNYEWARWHLVRGLASCTFWWASAKDFRLFGPLSWSPDEIERGLNELTRAVRSLHNPATKQAKLKVENWRAELLKTIWRTHWQKYWLNQK